MIIYNLENKYSWLLSEHQRIVAKGGAKNEQNNKNSGHSRICRSLLFLGIDNPEYATLSRFCR